MKTAVVIALILVVLGSILLRHWGQGRRSASRGASASSRPPAPNETYLGLRNNILQGTRTKFSLPPTSDATRPWGVVMDWGVENGTATIVALSDGTASVYLSSGGGSIGGQSNQAINSAAKRAVSLASESQSKMRLTHSFPLPRRGEVIFYVLTDGGVFTAAATEEELQDGKHPLSRLGNAMQGVITQYRLLQGGR